MSNIIAYDNRFKMDSTGYDRHSIVVTPAVKITGMLWWRKQISGWAVKQADYFTHQFVGCVETVDTWYTLAFYEGEEEARDFANKLINAKPCEVVRV